MQRALRSAAHDPQYARYGVPIASIGLLGLLDKIGECRTSELADKLGVGASVVSRQVTDLERRGLVGRRCDPLDGRAALLAISPQGRALLDQIWEQQASTLRRSLEGWDDTHLTQAITVLDDLTAALLAGRPPHSHPHTPPSAGPVNGDVHLPTTRTLEAAR
jgi:DNA-binding MarR family transcriptional regulator